MKYTSLKKESFSAKTREADESISFVISIFPRSFQEFSEYLTSAAEDEHVHGECSRAKMSIPFTEVKGSPGTPELKQKRSIMGQRWVFLSPLPDTLQIEFTSKNYSNAYSSHQLNSLCFSFLIGTTLNYFLDGKINKAEILFPGVGCFLIAVCLGSAVHASNASDNRAKLNGVLKTNEVEAGNGYTFFFLSLFGFWNFIKHLGLFYCEDNAYFA